MPDSHGVLTSGQGNLLATLVSRLEDFGILLLDQQGQIISWHPGAEKLFGYRREEVLGKHARLLYTELDQAEHVAEHEFDDAARNGKASDTRWMRKRDGVHVMVAGGTDSLQAASGGLLGFGKVLVDFTERHKTEDRLVALTTALNQSTVIVRNWQGTIEHWTAGSERLYGFTPAEAIGADCKTLLKTVYPMPEADLIRQLVETNVWQGEVRQTTKDGRKLTVLVEWALLRDASGAPSRVIESQTDATDTAAMRRNLEKAHGELRALTSELERSNEELSDFARIASHDLSAPLTSASWLVDLLTSRYGSQLDERGQLYLNQVKQSLVRMLDLMDGILAHARAGMTTIRTEQFSDADQALTNALSDLQRDISLSEASIVREALPPVPIAAQAMAQLLQNLISNAIKYRKPGQRPSIHIRAESQDKFWLFSVQDNGIGIENAWLERVFQPMQRLHDTSIAGSGIGLATCRKIVSRAGGKIWAESDPEHGSTFFFTLPKGASEATAEVPPPPHAALTANYPD